MTRACPTMHAQQVKKQMAPRSLLFESATSRVPCREPERGKCSAGNYMCERPKAEWSTLSNRLRPARGCVRAQGPDICDNSVSWPAWCKQQVTYSIYPRKHCKVPSEASDVAERAGKDSCFRPKSFEALSNDVHAHTQPRTPSKSLTQRARAREMLCR